MTKYLALIALALPVAFGSSAMAATQVYGPTTFGTYTAGTSGSFNFPKFNPALGTLTGVDLAVTGNSYGGSNIATNTSEFAGEGTVNVGTDIHVSGPGSLVVLSTPIETATGTALAGGGQISVFGTNSTDTEYADLPNIHHSDLSGYIGAGNVTYSFTSDTDTSTALLFSPNSTSSSPTTFEFIPVVTYTYTPAPVPEPASLGLLGVGALGLLAKRRRA